MYHHLEQRIRAHVVLCWLARSSRTAIITLAAIPEEAYRYLLGSRSAVEWIIDRYRVTTDKASGIVNDPNDWCAEHDDPRYIVDLLTRIVTVTPEDDADRRYAAGPGRPRRAHRGVT